MTTPFYVIIITHIFFIHVNIITLLNTLVNLNMQKRNKKILDKVKEVTHTDMVTILQNLDRDLVKGALSGAKFKEYFPANCKCDKIAAAVKELV